MLFVCGHRPKTKELLELFLSLFLLIFKWKKFSLTGNWTGVLQLPSQAVNSLSYSHIVTQVVKNYLFNLRMSKTMPQTLDQYWSTLVSRWANPGPFLFSSLWTGNWSSQQDSNRAHQSRRREHWPLDHHHGPVDFAVKLVNWLKMVFFFKWSISGLFCISQKSTKWSMNVPLVRISGVGSDCSKNCVTTSAYCYFKCGPITASFCLFSSFSHYNSNLNWKI